MNSSTPSTMKTSMTSLDCPLYTNTSDQMIDQFNFWVEGVTQTSVAIPGLIGNMVFSFILTRRELRNSFNLLLVALAFFDSCYIVGAILESLRVSFNLASDIHIMLFPYLLYPGQNLAMTGSIFMIVAIAFERYVAVHNPLDYKQAMNDADAIRRRLVKYLLPVVIASVLFNVPKFFEATFVYVTYEELGVNVTRVQLNITELRIHPSYSIYVNWSQSLVLGFIPAALLVYFNTKIYLDVRERERRKRPRKVTLTNGYDPKRKSQEVVSNSGGGSPLAAASDNSDEMISDVEPTSIPVCSTITKAKTMDDAVGSTKLIATVISPPPQTNGKSKQSKKPRKSKKNADSPPTPTKSNARRRKAEDKMAMMFVAIVTGFLMTNFPRILLNFHEILVFDNAMACNSAGFRTFPVWSRILNSFSHLLMVINSSMNILFYGLFNARFRQVARVVFLNGRQPMTNIMTQNRASRNTAVCCRQSEVLSPVATVAAKFEGENDTLMSETDFNNALKTQNINDTFKICEQPCGKKQLTNFPADKISETHV